MGGINHTILDEIEEMERMEGQTMKKKMNLVAVAACCVLLMGAGTGLVRYFEGGGHVVYDDDGNVFGAGFTHMADEVFVEEGEELHYIFQGNQIEISQYCNETDYFIHPVLDEHGTGYVMVIGGEEGERGYALNQYSNGEFIMSQSELEGYESDLTMIASLTPENMAGYPQFIWSRHSNEFLGYYIDTEWYSLPDTMVTDFGTATKIGEAFYMVEGEALGDFSLEEQAKIIQKELQKPESWIKSMGTGGSYVREDSYRHEVSIYDTWSEEREEEVRGILDGLGFDYELEFRG